MKLWIPFCICLIVEAICTPWYLKALWPEKCRKSLILKMVCASMFVSIGVLSMFIANNFSQYALTMVIGLVFGFIGDYFLHAKPSNAYFVTGFISFLIGHIWYIVAYCRAIPVLYPDYKSFNIAEIAAGIVLIIGGLLLIKLCHIKFSPKVLKYAMAVYFLVITFMFLKASALGWNYYQSGAQGGIICFLLLSMGALFFILSDSTLGVIIFGGQKKNYPLKIFNIVTYFWGQVMLAASILFINA